MRILINDIAASSGGAITILKQFYNYILANDTENEWIFFLGDKFLEEKNNIKVVCFPKVKASHFKKVLFDCCYGQMVIERYNPDVILSLQNIIVFRAKQPQFLYVHQSIPFQNAKKFSFFKKDERKLAMVQYIIGFFIKRSIKKADKVFVQTNWMRKAIEKYTGGTAEKIISILPNVDEFKPCIEKYQTNRFFYPTSNHKYKNNDVIVKACNILNEDGINDFTVYLTLPEGTVKHKNIICTGILDKCRMQTEYQSSCLLYPSSIETVGLPLLEARECSTMIIAADTPFSRECLAGYSNATFFTRCDENQLANEMKNIIIYNKKPSIENMPTDVFSSGWGRLYEEITKAY